MLEGIEALLTGARSRYPKLSAVIKFVPKKNGLVRATHAARRTPRDADRGTD